MAVISKTSVTATPPELRGLTRQLQGINWSADAFKVHVEVPQSLSVLDGFRLLIDALFCLIYDWLYPGWIHELGADFGLTVKLNGLHLSDYLFCHLRIAVICMAQRWTRVHMAAADMIGRTLPNARLDMMLDAFCLFYFFTRVLEAKWSLWFAVPCCSCLGVPQAQL